jgi:NADPH-dependent 2,4-dienoyl-CoA reductase/sulfur reductase-like enzyme
VVLAEAAPRLGGAFRLAGMQPRRGQIIDLLDWYERQLAALRVDVRLETLVDAAWIADLAPGKVVLATGSLPDESGFQKALPAQPALPGAELGQVFTAEAVMAREARVGERVIVLDEAGGWRGCGTAWKLAEAGHRVTIVTPDPYVGRELTRTSADLPLRQKLRQLGVEWRLETAVAQWHGTHATLVDLNTGEQELLEADSLVLAASRQAANWLAEELSVHGMEFIAIGDCTAPRQAPWAFYDGRKAGQAL